VIGRLSCLKTGKIGYFTHLSSIKHNFCTGIVITLIGSKIVGVDMPKFKLLPLTLLISFAGTVNAEHVTLPALSIEGAGAEEIPYALPFTTVSSPDIGDVVKRLPGANINKNGPLTSIAQYRGLFSDRVNVLIDGVRLSQAGPNRMDSPLSYIASSRLQDIEIYRGIAPVSSGIETIGGTMKANSKRADFGSNESFETHGNVTTGYATNGNTRFGGITASTANEHHRFQVAGSADRGQNTEFGEGKIKPSQHERDTLGLSYGFQKAGHEVNLDIEHTDTGATGTPALPMDIIFARGEHYTLDFTKALYNGDTFKARINYQDAEHRMSNYTFRPTMAAMQRHADADVESAGLSLSYVHANWTFGFDADQADHNTNIYNPTNASFYVNNFNDVERDRYSVFTEWNGTLAPNWSLESGVRLSRVAMDAGDVDSSMGMAGVVALRDQFNASDRSQDENLMDLTLVFTHNITHHLDLELGLARKQRAASYQERYLWLPMQSTSGLADGNNHVGNVNLDAETSYQVELGLDWHTAEAGFSPRVFYHHINDYIQGVASNDATVIAISTMMGGDTTPLQYQNVDAKLYGFDANWYALMTSEWQLDGTISYVRGERRDTHDDLYRIAPLSARTMLSYVQPTWRLGVEVETVAAQNKVSTENEEQKTAGYALFNLVGSVQPTQDITVSAGINNLFDRSYQDHLAGYNRIANNPDIAQGDRLYGLGRSVYVGLDMNW
jgi:iron complex outermembrane receptor protein